MNFHFGRPGITFRPVVASMWNSGKSTSEIGLVIGKSKSTVKRLVKQFGLPARQIARGWEARKARKAPKPKAAAPDPIGPIGTFPDTNCCRFIAGEPNEQFQCCGHPGYPWCEFHQPLCTTKPSGRML